MDSNLKTYLDNLKVEYIEHEHPAVFTVEESLKLKTKIPGVHTKSLFLKDKNSNYYLVCMNAHKRLKTNRLAKRFNSKKLYFASPEELNQKLSLTPGSVSIFGLINNKEKDVTLVLDQELWDAEKVSFHPNINTATLEISHEDLAKFYNSLNNKKIIINLEDA
jgi:Ala-tRNA(Pro) deacylase